MVMAAAGLLRSNAAPTDEEIAKALDRNVCRCGTYPRIVQAIRQAAARLRSSEGAAADLVRR
jgi:aerobic-type carbon monoxide dehydrogenase small subunit (CoxS/CutS family)